MRHSDLIVIGAGPAGMAAAATAAGHGFSVTLLDEQPRPGGQIYRDVDRVAARRGDILGADYTYGSRLTTALRHDNINHVSGAVVWAIEDGFRVSYTRDGAGAQVSGERILLATGALERPMPVPGWTLPGVMTAGAAQILLKQSGVLARRAVLDGARARRVVGKVAAHRTDGCAGRIRRSCRCPRPASSSPASRRR